MANKKPLSRMTYGEKYKYYKVRRNASLAGKWICVFTPFLVLFIVKFNEYFAIVDDGTRVKLSIGCIIALVVAVIALFKEAKQQTNSRVSSALGWGVAFVMSFLFSSILNDLSLILGCEFAGQVAAAGLGVYSDYCSKEAQAYHDLGRQDGTIIKGEK